jgi:hypothetical protein
MAEEAITLIPPGKLRCVITGKLRDDTPGLEKSIQ